MSRDLTVVIPTVDGRERYLAQLKASLRATAPEATIHVYRNKATCGEVWNLGAEFASTPLVTMLADDLVPHAGWWEAALEVVERGHVPAPYLWTVSSLAPGAFDELRPAARTFESGGRWQVAESPGTVVAWSAVPFCRTEWWLPIPPIHYYSDNAYTDAQAAHGRRAIVAPGFAFDHYWAQEGRQTMHGPQWWQEEAAWQAYRAGLVEELALKEAAARR